MKLQERWRGIDKSSTEIKYVRKQFRILRLVLAERQI